MKTFFRVITMLVLSTILLLSSVNVTSAASAVIKSTRFSLNGYNGPLYMDVNFTCPSGAKIDTNSANQWKNIQQYGPVNATVRAYFYKFNPNTLYLVRIKCFSSSNRGVIWEYSVKYGAGKMQINRYTATNF